MVACYEPRPVSVVLQDMQFKKHKDSNIGRFVNLCNGDSCFATEDAWSGDSLPIDDKMWAQNVSFYTGKTENHLIPNLDFS